MGGLQMAEALGSKSVGSFVALVSVWNFLGRMGAGSGPQASPSPTNSHMAPWLLTPGHSGTSEACLSILVSQSQAGKGVAVTVGMELTICVEVTVGVAVTVGAHHMYGSHSSGVAVTVGVEVTVLLLLPLRRYISEHYMKRYSTPRPVFMIAVQAAMGCAHLLFATGGKGRSSTASHWAAGLHAQQLRRGSQCTVQYRGYSSILYCV